MVSHNYYHMYNYSIKKLILQMLCRYGHKIIT